MNVIRFRLTACIKKVAFRSTVLAHSYASDAMKLLIALVVFIAYCRGRSDAYPHPSATFSTPYTATVWTGSTKIDNIPGFMGEDDGAQRFVSCATPQGGPKYCYLSVTTSPSLTQTYNYLALNNGTVIQCNVSSQPIGWQSMWGWLPYSTLHGRTYKCGQMMNLWQFHLGQVPGMFLALGVSMANESIPLMYNYTFINQTTHERTEDFFCLSDFTSEPPRDLAIPRFCLKEGMSNQSIPKSGNQRFLPSYFATPPAIRASAMAAWLRNAH